MSTAQTSNFNALSLPNPLIFSALLTSNLLCHGSPFHSIINACLWIPQSTPTFLSHSSMTPLLNNLLSLSLPHSLTNYTLCTKSPSIGNLQSKASNQWQCPPNFFFNKSPKLPTYRYYYILIYSTQSHLFFSLFFFFLISKRKFLLMNQSPPQTIEDSRQLGPLLLFSFLFFSLNQSFLCHLLPTSYYLISSFCKMMVLRMRMTSHLTQLWPES